MAYSYGRARGTEAPMTGIEFTNRGNTIPAWRADPLGQNSALKRSHSIANPPPTPFDPKSQEPATRQIFGENVRYLFNPPPVQYQTSTPGIDVSDVDMKDVEVTPTHPPSPGKPHNKTETSRNDKQDIENEIPERRLISNAAVRRIKRSQKMSKPRSLNRSRSDRQAAGAQVMDGDEDDDEDSADDDGFENDGSSRKLRLKPVTQNTSNHYTLNMTGPGPAKADTPYVLLGYLQFLFNLSLILVFLYLLVQFIFTVQRDVEHRIGEYSMEILQEVTTCAQLYKQNLCDTNPIPAMIHQCANWETCMHRDPSVVGRAKVGAEMLAEVVNGFVEPISWKTLLFTLSSLSFLTVFVNALLSLYRSRHSPDRQERRVAQPPMIPHFPSIHSSYRYLSENASQSEWSYPQMSWHPDSSIETLPRQRRRLDNGQSVPLMESPTS